MFPNLVSGAYDGLDVGFIGKGSLGLLRIKC